MDRQDDEPWGSQSWRVDSDDGMRSCGCFQRPGHLTRLGIVLILSKTGKVHSSPPKVGPNASFHANSRAGQVWGIAPQCRFREGGPHIIQLEQKSHGVK